MKQDDELREKNMADKNENNLDNPNDILALLQDYSDEDFTSNDLMEPNNIGKSLIDDMDLDNTDDDLLALLDMIAEQDQTEGADNNVFALDKTEPSLDEEITQEDDNSNDDILALSDLWNDDLDITLNETFQEDSNYGDSSYDESSSLGDIFSDVLSAVSHEKDNDTSISVEQEFSASDEILTTKEAAKESKKKGLFSKFLKTDKENPAELEEKNSKETTEKKKEAKDKKAKKNATVKAAKDAKKQSVAEAKKEKKKSASSKKEKKAIEKKPAKPKKLKNKTGEKIIKEVQAPEVAERPLNKKLLGALSVMILSFGILIVFGTRAYTEALSVENATTNFERRRYTEAYNELYGLSRNSRNEEIYDKVMTVMYVNKHLNTYNNFYSLALYPEALDSLIKGLQRYEQYIDRAIDLGIESDMNFVKDSILKELEGKFGVHEEKAVKLSKVEDKIQYSKYVYNIADNVK